MTGDNGFLPSDVLREILLRLPARPLCRFRAVSRTWRSMLLHPGFAATHASRSRHHAPLFNLAVINDDDATLDFVMLDQSGNKIRRVPAGSWCCEATLGTHHHLASITMPMSSDQARMVDLESGAVSFVPLQLHAQGQHAKQPHNLFLGRASTGEHKALLIHSHFGSCEQLCRVLTLAGNGRDVHWRERQTPPATVKTGGQDVAVVNGIMYFFKYPSDMVDGVVCFDLGAEKWLPTVLPGPTSSICADKDYSIFQAAFLLTCLHLTALNGNLVSVHRNVEKKHLGGFSTMDLWFCVESSLADGKVQWERRYSVSYGNEISLMMPLWELDDGRLAMVAYPKGCFSDALNCFSFVLRIYDPTTDTCVDVAHMDRCVDFSTFTGGLLSYC